MRTVVEYSSSPISRGRRIAGRCRRSALAGSALALAVVASTALAGCTGEAASEGGVAAAVVEEVAGSDLAQITLTEDAARRTGLETTAVSSQSGTSIPYSALLYDPDGGTWVYTTTEPLVFVRHPVQVESIEGDQVRLSEGPPDGAEIVTVGVAELYGAELGIGQ